MRTPILLAMAAVAAAGGPVPGPQLHVVLAVDISRSTKAEFEAAKTEQQTLLGAVPDGSRCTVITVGSSAVRAFDGVLDKGGRASAARVIASLEAKDWYSDLIAGVKEAVDASSGSPARQIWLYTDGQLQPKPGSPYRGRAFGPMLDEAPLPHGARLFVRLISGGKLEVHRSGIAVLKQAPDWAVQFKMEPAAPEPPAKTGRTVWLGGSAAAMAAGLAGLAFLLKRMREVREQQALRAHATFERPTEAASPEPRTCRRFRVLTDGAPAIELSTEGQRSVIVGRSALADVEFPDLDGSVQLRLDGARGRETAVLENTDCGSVYVGARRVPAGHTQALPAAGLEFRVGPRLFVMYPEELEAGGEQ